MTTKAARTLLTATISNLLTQAHHRHYISFHHVNYVNALLHAVCLRKRDEIIPLSAGYQKPATWRRYSPIDPLMRCMHMVFWLQLKLVCSLQPVNPLFQTCLKRHNHNGHTQVKHNCYRTITTAITTTTTTRATN